jgi:nitroreductase
MNFLELAKTRFSSRKYLNKPVEKEKLLKILEAARIAPSAANKQPWIFYVVQDENNKKLISDTYHREWLKAAPVIIIACTDHNKGWIRSDKKDHCDIDLAIAIDHITLQAAELGLGTCWICNFDTKKCREILNLPSHIEPVALIPVAYPADVPDIKRHDSARKQLNEIVKWEFQ